jgi:hypothetical protein
MVGFAQKVRSSDPSPLLTRGRTRVSLPLLRGRRERSERGGRSTELRTCALILWICF